ncbi:reverse transcriptase domain-containing protein, partial [Tanacetum coccineum]
MCPKSASEENLLMDTKKPLICSDLFIMKHNPKKFSFGDEEGSCFRTTSSPKQENQSPILTKESISAVLLAEREKRQVLIYFISRVLQGAELNYLELEKLILALFHAARRLQRYFQAYPVWVLADKPIKQILTRPEKSGRIAKWAIKLGEHDIKFKGRDSIKGQILANFLVKTSFKEDKDTEIKKPEASNKASKLKTRGSCIPIEPQALMVQNEVAFCEGADRTGARVFVGVGRRIDFGFLESKALTDAKGSATTLDKNGKV